jgi:TonB family protein
MIAGIAKSTIILAVALIAYALMRRRSASERHVVLLGGVLGSLLPFVWLALQTKLPAATPSYALRLPRQALNLFPAPVYSMTVSAGGMRWSWADWALAAWLAGVCVLALYRGMSYFAASQIARRSHPLGWSTPVPVRGCAEIRSPVLAGLLRPVILLPEGAREWPAGKRAAVLAHECAHVARLDHWWHVAVEVVRCLYWVNPLVWIVASRMMVERERACDDLVLTRGIDAHDYASHLIEFARQQRRLPVAAMAEVSNLEGRLMAILDPEVRRNSAWRGALLAAMALVVLTLPVSLGNTGPTSRTVATVVVDASGAAVPNAAVLLKPAAGGVIERESGEDGTAAFPGIASGMYSLEVHARGFRVASSSLEVLPGTGPLVRKVTMELGHAQETIGVEAERPAGAAPQLAQVSGPASKGGKIDMPKLAQMVHPVYPPDAKAAGVEGSVVLQVVLTKEGSPISLKAIASPAENLSQAAMDAVKGWRWDPAKLNGEPVEVVTDITINFTLK